jgi:hypothetical protein
MNAQHLQQTAEHGTPPEYVELARYVLGALDLDPASSAYWNHYIVKATRFYDERLDGLKQPWRGRLIVNPPSDDTPAAVRAAYKRKGERAPRGNPLVRKFWERLVDEWRRGAVHSAVWIGFSLEQLVHLQSSPVHPLQLINLVPASRIPFMERQPGNAAPTRSTSPTHGNYICLLSTRTSATESKDQARRFVERASSLELGGALIRPL